MTEYTVSLYEIPGALGDREGYRLYRAYVSDTISDDDVLVFPAKTDCIIAGLRDQAGTNMEFDNKDTSTSGFVKYTVNATTATTVEGLVLIK